MSTYHSSVFITRLSHKVWKHSTNYIFLTRACLAHCTLLFTNTCWVLLNFIYLLRFPTFSRKNGVSNSGFSSYFFLGLLGMQIVQYLKLKDFPPIFVFQRKFFLAVNFFWNKSTIEISVTWDSLNQRKTQNKTKQKKHPVIRGGSRL